jgi:alkylhydroperoxidase/carboxymuconolactone decarboxylase family protein YurZ
MATDGSDQFLTQLADNNPELIERLVGRYVENVSESGLDPRTHALVRLASLIAVGAPAASFAWQVAMAREAGATDDEIAGVLAAVSPTVGTPRVVAAAPHVAQALVS